MSLGGGVGVGGYALALLGPLAAAEMNFMSTVNMSVLRLRESISPSNGYGFPSHLILQFYEFVILIVEIN